MCSKDVKNFYKKDKVVNNMPSVKLIEHERVTYISEMEEYLNKLKKMEKNQARKISLENLKKSQIIGENGEFTEHYKFSRRKVIK